MTYQDDFPVEWPSCVRAQHSGLCLTL